MFETKQCENMSLDQYQCLIDKKKKKLIEYVTCDKHQSL